MFVDLINAPARRQVDDSLAAAKSKSALLQRLEGLDEEEQHAVLLDLVRSHIATVLGNTTPEAIDPDRAFQELGFDSLTAVEMRNRLKAATGLGLSPTLIFDYPNSAALAATSTRNCSARRTRMRNRRRPRRRGVAARRGIHPGQAAAPGGVLDLLLALANESDGDRNGAAAAPQDESTGKDLADMDLDDLVNAAFMDDDE